MFYQEPSLVYAERESGCGILIIIVLWGYLLLFLRRSESFFFKITCYFLNSCLWGYQNLIPIWFSFYTWRNDGDVFCFMLQVSWFLSWIEFSFAYLSLLPLEERKTPYLFLQAEGFGEITGQESDSKCQPWLKASLGLKRAFWFQSVLLDNSGVRGADLRVPDTCCCCPHRFQAPPRAVPGLGSSSSLW